MRMSSMISTELNVLIFQSQKQTIGSTRDWPIGYEIDPIEMTGGCGAVALTEMATGCSCFRQRSVPSTCPSLCTTQLLAEYSVEYGTHSKVGKL